MTGMAMLLAGQPAFAKGILDWIRNYDLNNYALGVAVTGSQSPYVDADASTFAYPFLTSFRDPAFTKDWLLLRDGGLGVRWVTNNDWELSLFGRVETLGTGTNESPALEGIANKKWALEMGPRIGWRGWPVQIHFTTLKEVSGRHGGLANELSVSLPWEGARGFINASVSLTHKDADFTNYYYGVSADEALPGRPEYVPGDSVVPEFDIFWGYALSDKWLLKGSVGIDFLDSAITNSPIVDREELWSVNLGIAYNADVFEPRESQRSVLQPGFEFRVGAFSDNVDSKIVRDTEGGVPGSEIDLEDELGLDDTSTIAQFDAVIRLNHFHRLEVGYFQISRSGLTTLPEDITFADQTFAAATDVASSFETKLLRIGYAFSLMNDDQKELGVMAGVHFPQFITRIEAPGAGQEEFSKASTPLPVIGLHGSVALGAKMRLGARIQAFRMHFDHYEGTLNYATLDLQRRFGQRFSLGLGYNYYGFRLESREDKFDGRLQIRHHGPVLFANMGF